MSNQAEIITTRGNDFFLRVNLYKKLDNEQIEPFDLTACDNYTGSIKNEYSETPLAESIGLVEGTINAIAIDCAGLELGMCYVVEITGSLDGRHFRCAEKCVLGVTEYNANASVSEQTIEAGIGVDLNMTFELLESSAIVGKNAYELAVEQGYEGTLQDYLDEMVDAGQSAQAADDAAQAANQASQTALNSAASAQAASNAANQAAQTAQASASEANTQATFAQQAAQAANTAATNANNASSQLAIDYVSTKTQLNTDYNQTKTQLNTDYNQTKTNLNNDYISTKNNLTQDVNDMINNLSTVATTGNYNDLTNKPTIPTTSADIDAMPRKIFLGNTRENYFAKDVYISVLDNALYAAPKRFNTSCVITDAGGNTVNRNVYLDQLFNYNYDNSTALLVGEGETAVLSIMGGSTADETRLSDIVYSEGYVYIHCYGTKFPSSVTGRLYSTNSSTLGWHSFTFEPLENSSCVLVGKVGNWPLASALELTIEGANYTGSPAMSSIVEIEWDVKRHPTSFGLFSKGQNETIYYPLTCKGTVRVENALTAQSFIRSGGTASQLLLANGTVKNTSDFALASNVKQSDWNQATSSSIDYIKNKPTKVSDFTNDSGFISSSTVTTIVTMTQSQYDALATKDNNTIYNIIEE